MALKLEVPSEALLQVYSGDPKRKVRIKNQTITGPSPDEKPRTTQ